MDVPSERILRDLWVLKYHHETIHERLLRVKNMGIDNLNPWMVRCSEDILNRYIAHTKLVKISDYMKKHMKSLTHILYYFRFITISQETKTILGESDSKQTYLASRLNVSVENVQEMCFKIPALKTIRVTKVA
ncbi:hypothetical protein PYW08_001108 [Mythimna loreyi]|uniref:Uncharacterized protein n=1 Tax=Mythimna loreyi TaxID=667449 RepID=A0ACC2QZF6_9NEOP|nr:hypothetical protein PYW08_001108 [Mythimna loreyi]